MDETANTASIPSLDHQSSLTNYRREHGFEDGQDSASSDDPRGLVNLMDEEEEEEEEEIQEAKEEAEHQKPHSRPSFSLKKAFLSVESNIEESSENGKPKSPRSGLFNRASDPGEKRSPRSPRGGSHVRSKSLFRGKKLSDPDTIPQSVSLTEPGGLGKPKNRRDQFKNQRRSRSVSDVFSAGPDELEEEGVFGMSLDELLAKDYPDGDTDEKSTPLVLRHLLLQVERCNGFESEGIFRLSVGTLVKRTAMLRLHRRIMFDDSNDPHLYCVLLKEWIGRLPTPLLADYDKCLELAQSSDSGEEDRLLNEIWEGATVPARAVLRSLMSFVEKVAAHEQATRMGVSSLCLVLSATILRPEVEPSALDMLRDQPLTQSAMVKLYTWILQKRDDDEMRNLSVIY